ncbi:MAG: TrmB family transcriptional regulator [Candidatus Pacearchaeota archaeon]
MLQQQEKIKKIKDYFELNDYETKVWLALLSKGTASAGEISNASGVPRSRTYDVLEGLEAKGFAIVKIGKPVKYMGVKPKTVLEKLKQNERQKAEKKIKDLTNIQDTEEFTEIEKLYKEGFTSEESHETSAAIKGKANISNHLKEMFNNAKKEVVICTKGEDIANKINIYKKTFEDLKKDGVKIRLAFSGNEKVIQDLEKKFNQKIKRTELDSKFFIIDRMQALFYLNQDEGEDRAIWLNSEFFGNTIATLFEASFK